MCIRDRPQADYVAYLAKLAAQAATTGTETLVFNAKDQAACGQAVVDAANAVSYTHLDVYKRQAAPCCGREKAPEDDLSSGAFHSELTFCTRCV